MSRAARHAALQKDFGFACRCAACDQDEAGIAKSDARRAEINTLVDRVAEWGAMGPSQRPQVLQGLRRMRELLKAEGYVASEWPRTK